MSRHLFLSLLFFVLISAICCSCASLHDGHSRPYSAERLIRHFNLFPKQDVNIVVDDKSSIAAKPVIVEKRLNLPVLDAGQVENLGHHAGYYGLPNSKAARMFYYFFESRNTTDDPVVLWLSGGPGCSCSLAMFYENGPFSINNDLNLVDNPFGWDKVSNLLYVDQPTGTGFSFSNTTDDLRHDENGVSTDLYDFLQAFFGAHSSLTKNDFYITGESYAGHYIPALATRIQQANKASQGIHINLKGIAIGNGLTNPEIQYKAYADYALQEKLITDYQYRVINEGWPDCEDAIKKCGTDGEQTCNKANSVCGTIMDKILQVNPNINIYDIRKKCQGDLCYDFSNMEKFLNQKSVRDALGVGSIPFVSCSRTVYDAMRNDMMRNLEVGIPALLEDGIRVLVYAGEKDLICNALGNSRWVDAMVWSGQKDFVDAPEIIYFVEDNDALGTRKNYGPLTLILVGAAGHMVPMDRPKESLEMLRRWMHGEQV